MTDTDDNDLGRELIASMQEAAAIVRGEVDAARVHLPPGDVDVRAIRERLGLTRARFRAAVRVGGRGRARLGAGAAPA